MTVARSAGTDGRGIMDLPPTNGGIPATTDERGGRGERLYRVLLAGQ